MTPVPVHVVKSAHYSWVALVMRDFFRWRWIVVELPGMRQVASGWSWKVTAAQNRAFDVALRHAIGD